VRARRVCLFVQNSNVREFSQGCYSREGDIVVLCAYLGQLAKVRDALSHEVAVVIDERDEIALAEREDDDEKEEINALINVDRIAVSKRVS
jgi:hypothetical protein